MAKFRQSPLQYVVKFNGYYMKVKQWEVSWIADVKTANLYGSKYAAKEHMKRLTGLPEGVSIELLNEQ